MFNQNLFNPNNIIQQVGCTINNDEITITDSSGWGQSYIICGEKLYAGKYTCSVYGNSGTVQLVIRGYKNGAIYEQRISNYYTYNTYYKSSSNGNYSIFNDKLQFTLPNDCDYYYACIVLSRDGTETIKVKVEKGEIENPTYTPHAEQNAPLSLGNTELFEGDEIQIDYVQKAGYKKVTGARFVKNIGKVVLDGSENWIYFTTTNKPLFYIETDQENINYKVEANLTCFSNNFKGVGQKTSFDDIYDLGNNSIGFRTAYPRLAIRYDDIQNKDDFKTFLSTHNTELVYPLATPVTTEITDPTLLAQFETLINMKTYKDITNIESTGADLAPVIDFEYYRDMSTLNDRLDSLEARVALLEE